jgi:hypothetical protein
MKCIDMDENLQGIARGEEVLRKCIAMDENLQGIERGENSTFINLRR